MAKTITHGLTTAQPDNPAYDVSADEINQHQETFSGLTAGHVMRASAATAADFAAIQDGDLPATIARDSEVTAAVAALSMVYQPLDSDLTAIAALSTTSFGRSLLALADQAALLSAAGAAASGHNHSGAYQPLDSDLTSIAALTTTAFGRAFLALVSFSDFVANLPADASVTGTEKVYVDDASVDKWVTTQQIADLAGSGLPSQWIKGTNGDVIATVDDDTKTAITIKGTIAQQVAHTPLLRVVDAIGETAFYIELEDNGSGLVRGGQLKVGQHDVSAGGRPRLEYEWDDNDEDGSSTLVVYGADGVSFVAFETFADHLDPTSDYATLQIRQPAGQSSTGEPAIRVDLAGSPVFRVLSAGAPVTSQNNGPADGDLNATECSMWFDATNGVAAVKFKGKSADGTVVTATVPLT